MHLLILKPFGIKHISPATETTGIIETPPQKILSWQFGYTGINKYLGYGLKKKHELIFKPFGMKHI